VSSSSWQWVRAEISTATFTPSSRRFALQRFCKDSFKSARGSAVDVRKLSRRMPICKVRESRVVANTKKMFLQAAGGAVARIPRSWRTSRIYRRSFEYGDGDLCDGVLPVGPQTASSARGEAATAVMQDAARVFYRVRRNAWSTKCKVAQLRLSRRRYSHHPMAVLKRFGKARGVDTIALRRKGCGCGAGARPVSFLNRSEENFFCMGLPVKAASCHHR